MKKTLLFLFFSILSFSQEKELTVSQIDSITLPNSIKTRAEGDIKRKNGKRDYIFLTTYFNLKDSISKKLIKGELYEIESFDSYSYSFQYNYYYHSDKPFYLKLTINKILEGTNKKESIIIELNENDLRSNKEINNPFLLKLRKKIKAINKALLHYHYPNEN